MRGVDSRFVVQALQKNTNLFPPEQKSERTAAFVTHHLQFGLLWLSCSLEHLQLPISLWSLNSTIPKERLTPWLASSCFNVSMMVVVRRLRRSVYVCIIDVSIVKS